MPSKLFEAIDRAENTSSAVQSEGDAASLVRSAVIKSFDLCECRSPSYYSYTSIGYPICCAECKPPQKNRVKHWYHALEVEGEYILCDRQPLPADGPLYDGSIIEDLDSRNIDVDKLLSLGNNQMRRAEPPKVIPKHATVFYLKGGRVFNCVSLKQIPDDAKSWTYDGGECWWPVKLQRGS